MRRTAACLALALLAACARGGAAAAPAEAPPVPDAASPAPSAAAAMCDAAAPAPAGACPAEPPPADVQAEAALLARCFHSAVVVLDREPGETEPLARFFAEAAAAATACGSPGLPGLALFRAAADGGTLLFSDGREVLAEHGPESRDLFEDGREEVSRTWRFHTADGSASAETTLTLTFGGSPD